MHFYILEQYLDRSPPLAERMGFDHWLGHNPSSTSTFHVSSQHELSHAVRRQL